MEGFFSCMGPCQAYITNTINICVCLITTGQYSNIMTFDARKASVAIYLIMLYR